MGIQQYRTAAAARRTAGSWRTDVQGERIGLIGRIRPMGLILRIEQYRTAAAAAAAARRTAAIYA